MLNIEKLLEEFRRRGVAKAPTPSNVSPNHTNLSLSHVLGPAL